MYRLRYGVLMTLHLHGNLGHDKQREIAGYIATHLPNRLVSRTRSCEYNRETAHDIAVYIASSHELDAVVDRMAANINAEISRLTDDPERVCIGFGWFVGKNGSHVVADNHCTGISVRVRSPHCEVAEILYWLNIVDGEKA